MFKAIALFFALTLGTQTLGHSMSNSELYKEIHGDGVYSVAQKQEANRKIRALEREFKSRGFVHLAEKSTFALDGIFRIATMNLKRKNHHALAERVHFEWKEHRTALIVMALNLETPNPDQRERVCDSLTRPRPEEAPAQS